MGARLSILPFLGTSGALLAFHQEPRTAATFPAQLTVTGSPERPGAARCLPLQAQARKRDVNPEAKVLESTGTITVMTAQQK